MISTRDPNPPPPPPHEVPEDENDIELLQTKLEPLQFGDVVYFFFSRGKEHAASGHENNKPFSGFMQADTCIERIGFQTQDQGNNPSNFHECLFQVLPMMNYDSSTSKAELSRRNSFSQNKSEKVMLEHRIRQEYAQNEIAVKKFQAGKHKTNVLYGQIIQLKHLGTGKWLQGNTYTADKEHDCLRLGLSEGDENCHFRIMPRFRIRREGSMAYFGDMLHLHSEKLPGYSIRVTEEPFDIHEPKPHVHELNLSLIPSALKVLKFYRPASKDLTLVNTNIDYVRFFHAESQTFLQGSCEHRKVGERDDFIDHVKGSGSLSASDGLASEHGDPPRRRSSFFANLSPDSMFGSTSAAANEIPDGGEDGEYLNLGSPRDPSPTNGGTSQVQAGETREHCPFFSPLIHTQPNNLMNISPKSMFIFEYQTRLISGFVRWNSPVRIKHVATGRYLYVDSNSDPSLSSSKLIHRCFLVDDVPGLQLDRTLFHIVPTDQQGEYVPETHVSMRILHHIVIDAKTTIILHATKRKVKEATVDGSDGEDFGLFFSEKKNDHDALIMMPLEKNSSFEKSMKLALAMERTFEWFSSRIIARQPVKYEHIKRVERVLAKLIYFSDKYFSASDFDKLERSKSYNPFDSLSSQHEVSRSFQLLAKDSKLLDKVFKLVVSPTTLSSVTMDFDTKTQKFTSPIFRNLEGIIKLSWKALEYIIMDNRTNENYFASNPSWINPGVVVQMPYPLGAATTFSTLITNNASLLETVIDRTALAAFEDLIIQNGPNPRLMSFFTAICSCLNQPILSNQETVLQHLIMDEEKHSKILLNIKEDESSVPQEWSLHKGSVMNPSPLVEPEAYLGKEEAKKGWKMITVSWDKLATMENFYINGRQYCDLGEFCSPLVAEEEGRRSRSSMSTPSRHSPVSPGTGDDLKEYKHLELAKYLVAQVDLFSKMCLGRSYNCIHIMQSKFPYILLVNLLTQQQGLPKDLKRAFADLLSALWLDRYPHFPMNLPQRYWVVDELELCDIQSERALASFKLSETHQLRNNSDPFYSFSSHHKFFLLVDLVVGYFESLGGEQVVGKTSQNALTASILNLTHDLIRFGFVGSEVEIKRLLDCIVACLDGRNDSLDSHTARNSTRLSVGVVKRKETAATGVLHDLKLEGLTGGDSSNQFVNGIIRRREYGNLRYLEDSNSSRVMACKKNIIEVLRVVEQLRANYRLSQLLASIKFREGLDVGNINSVSELVMSTLTSSELNKSLDVEEASTSPLDTVLLDLMMYESDALYEQAFIFMQNRYNENALMTKLLPTLTILEDSRIPIFEDYSCLLESLQQLQYYIRSYDVWAVESLASPMDLRSYNHTCYLLNKLLVFIYAPSYMKQAFGNTPESKEHRIARIERYCTAERKAINKETEKVVVGLAATGGARTGNRKRVTKRKDSVSDLSIFGFNSPPSEMLMKKGKSPNAQHQNLLRSANWAEIIKSVLRIEVVHMSRVAKLADESQSNQEAFKSNVQVSERWLFDVIKKSVFVAAGYAHENKQGQEDLMQLVPALVDKLKNRGIARENERDIFIWDLLVFIFHKNVALAEAVPMDCITSMAEFLVVKKEPRILHFFKGLVQPGRHESVIKTNQARVVEALVMNYNYLTLEFPRTQKGEDEGPKRAENDDTPIEEADRRWKVEVEFHTLSIEILALCAKGRNAKSSAKNQALLGLRSALNALHAANSNDMVRLKTALVQFINYTFVDTPLVDRKLSEKKELPEILRFASEQLDNIIQGLRKNPGSSGEILDCSVEEAKGYAMALLMLINSVLDVIFQNEINAPNTYIILSDMRKVLTRSELRYTLKGLNYEGEDMDEAIIEEWRLKCLNALEMKEEGVSFRIESRKFVDPPEMGDEDAGDKEGEEEYGQKEFDFSGEDSSDKDSGDEDSENVDIEKADVEERNLPPQATQIVPVRRSSNANGLRRPSTMLMSPFTQIVRPANKLPPILQMFKDHVMEIHSNTWSSQSYGAFLTKFEVVQDLTDPENQEYLEAGIGSSLLSFRRQLKRKISLRKRFFNANVRTLKMLQGTRMLFLILLLVAIAAAITISQIALEEDVEWVATIENIITYFFITELGLRVPVYIVVHRELDTFLMDPLNICDILVVTIDLIILSSPQQEDSESSGNDSAGFVKGLRSARGVRLLRVLRAARALRLLKSKKKMTMEEAFADPRSCKVTFNDLCTRMVKYCEANCRTGASEGNVAYLSIQLLVNHLRKHYYLRENPTEHLTDTEKIRMTMAEVRQRREMVHMEKQKMLTNDARAPELILKVISTCKGKIVDMALTLGEQLLCARNYHGQEVFFRAIDRGGRDGSFFVSIRDCLRLANESMKSYRELTVDSSKKQECKRQVCKSIPLLRFLSLLCEGHFEQTQEIMRGQPKNVVTVSVIEEVANLVYLLGRSLPVLREFRDFECEVLISCLAFLVECTQGPCKANQTYLAEMRKPVEVCKNIFCNSFKRVDNDKMRAGIFSKSMQLIAALLESRGDDDSIHLILKEQIPPPMLQARLAEVRKTDALIAKRMVTMGQEWEKDEYALFHEKLALNTAETIAIYNIVNELAPFGEVGRAFARITEEGGEQQNQFPGEEDAAESGSWFEAEYDTTSRLSRSGLDDRLSMRGGTRESDDASFDDENKDPYLEISSLERESCQTVDSVELVWHGECLKVHFTLPVESKSLSEREKEKFLDEVDCSTSESRMKGLVDQSDEFLEHMTHMHKLKNRFRLFSFLNTNYLAFKMGIFSLTLVMNFNMMLSTFQSLDGEESWFGLRTTFACISSPASGLSHHEAWNVFLSVSVLLGNLLVCVFISVSELPLALARSRRKRLTMRLGGSSLDKGFNASPLLNFIAAVVVYCMVAFIHKGSTQFKFKGSTYVSAGLAIFGAAFPFMLRSCLKSPRSQILNLFMDIFDTVSPVAFLMSFFQLIVSLVCMDKPFMMAFLLLDAGNMSKSLQLCFKAILIPFKQLLLTIMFFVIVIFVYASVAFQTFGIAGFNDSSGNEIVCSSFADCFVLTTYITFRFSDIAQVLDFPSLQDSNFGGRVLFDLTFFIICGMFLFNMIGGLILDTFTHIRDEKERRREVYNSEVFVSGITRNTIEEDPQYKGVTFSKLNEEDQSVWKYLFFIIYLKSKDSDEYTGVESFVANCLQEESLKWLPSKTCVAVEGRKRRGDKDSGLNGKDDAVAA